MIDGQTPVLPATLFDGGNYSLLDIVLINLQVSDNETSNAV